MSDYPHIYLAMDNCVFYKRWTRPAEWANKMAELGIYNIEASADTELDPLYMGNEYLKNWVSDVKKAESEFGVRVCSTYSGHGTYTTLGLTQDDPRVRERMIKDWFFPMVEISAELGCGMGFCAHAFRHEILQSREEYGKYIEILLDGLTQINSYGKECGCGNIGLEQMYTPHQFPWRMNDSKYVISEVTRRSGNDFYFTEDLGHHSRKFFRPEEYTEGCWLGSDRAFAIYDEKGADGWNEICADMDSNPHLFNTPEDADCYRSLSHMGCYSPIIHLQQTNGDRSVHEAFTPEKNAEGIIEPMKVLKAIKESYDREPEPGMPARCSDLYLTLELFSATTSIMHNLLQNCKTSVDYWRRFIPEDGLTLDRLVTE